MIMTKRKKILLGLVGVIVFGIAVFLYGGYRMFGDEIAAISTLKQVSDSAYTFTFKGDYGFKAFLEQGGAKTDADLGVYIQNFLSHGFAKSEQKPAPPKTVYGCTAFQGNNLLSRNFDYPPSGQFVVIVRAEPKDGYKSISTSTWSVMFGGDWHPIQNMDGMMALAAVYVPLDGMNEKGLCVADLVQIDGDSIATDTKKPDLTIGPAIRLVLDYAASVDEAIRVLQKYDIHTSVNSAHHLALADGKRDVVVEWDKGQMHVKDARVVTNHCLYQAHESDMIKESVARLKRVGDLRPTSPAEGLSAIQSASNDWTLWSVIYDRKSFSGTWYIRRHWDKPLQMAGISK